MDRFIAYEVGTDVFYINDYGRVKEGTITTVNISESENGTSIKYFLNGRKISDYRYPHRRVALTKDKLKQKLFDNE